MRLPINKVTDPEKKVTDPEVLKQLVQQGIDPDYVEFWHDYAPRGKGKGYSPYAKFYRDLKSGKRIMAVSGLPKVNADGVKICGNSSGKTIIGWKQISPKVFKSKPNIFSAMVTLSKVTITCDNDQPTGIKKGDKVTYHPQLFLNNVEQTCGDATLLETDPINPNYHYNVLEWDYGICKRRIRIIEGRIHGYWIFAQNPNGEVRIKYNQSQPRLKLSGYAINGDEEQVTTTEFNQTEYPLQIGDSATFYPDAHEETSSVDGRLAMSDADWATLRAKATGSHAQPSVAQGQGIQGEWYDSGSIYWLIRSPLLFDSSGLDDHAVISAATLSVYATGAGDNTETTHPADIQIVSCTPASNTDLVIEDFDQFGTTKFLDSAYDLGTFIGTAAYHNFILNALGIANISKVGVSSFAIRANNDFSDATAPSDRSYGTLYFADQGNGYQPKLIATYDIVFHETATVKIGTKITSTRLCSFIRSATVKVGAKVTATRLKTFIRTATVKVGIKATASLTRIRSATVKIGIKITGAWTNLFNVKVKGWAKRAYDVLGFSRHKYTVTGEAKRKYDVTGEAK